MTIATAWMLLPGGLVKPQSEDPLPPNWPQFEPGPSRDGLAPPSKVLEIWLGELDYAWRHAPGGLLTVTMHPECIGRGHRMAMLESFIDAAAALDGVVFDRLDRVVSRWMASRG